MEGCKFAMFFTYMFCMQWLCSFWSSNFEIIWKQSCEINTLQSYMNCMKNFAQSKNQRGEKKFRNQSLIMAVAAAAWQWREVPDRHMDTPWIVAGWNDIGWVSLSGQDSRTLQDHMDSHCVSYCPVGSKLCLSPLRIQSYEYTLEWAGDSIFFFTQKMDNLGVTALLCKPIKNRIFQPYVVSFWPGVLGVTLKSAFSGEEVCSRLLCSNEWLWSHMIESFQETFIELGLTYPEIRAVKLVNKDNEELNLEYPIEHDEDLLDTRRDDEESPDTCPFPDFWKR